MYADTPRELMSMQERQHAAMVCNLVKLMARQGWELTESLIRRAVGVVPSGAKAVDLLLDVAVQNDCLRRIIDAVDDDGTHP